MATLTCGLEQKAVMAAAIVFASEYKAQIAAGATKEQALKAAQVLGKAAYNMATPNAKEI